MQFSDHNGTACLFAAVPLSMTIFTTHLRDIHLMPDAAACFRDRIVYAFRLHQHRIRCFRIAFMCLFGISINAAATGSFPAAGNLMDEHTAGIT